jgi:peptide/nickel transport system permease protein
MFAYALRRIIPSIFTLLAMALLVFIGVFAIGDPIEILVDPAADQAIREGVRQSLGLDLPLYQQFFVFLKNAASGNFGVSFVHNTPAMLLILQRLPATLELAITAITIAVVVGIPLGMWAGMKSDSAAGKLIMSGSILGFSLPTFWVGLMLILLFSVLLGWLPAGGRGDTTMVLGVPVSFLSIDGLQHILLPAFTLALYKLALVIRLARAGTREVMQQDYIKFARAKGLSSLRIIFLHVLKNIMIPIVTVIGLEFGSLIAFAVVTETVFAWPGMGKLLIESMLRLDRPVIVAYLLLTVCLFIVINLLVDLVYSLLDPRVRLGGAK